VDRSYLPSATQHGAIVLSDALVSRVIEKDSRAAGVEGRLLGGPFGAPGHAFRIHAPVVVLACGTLHTPLVLLRQGIGKASGVVGKNITLHPAVRIVGRFDTPSSAGTARCRASTATTSPREASSSSACTPR
jgi:choline dehydrogenase-like flavoprotein